MPTADIFCGVMELRACVFVDGENFRRSIANLFVNFRRENYLPNNADWTGLFDWIVDEVTGGGERIRTYWYVIQSIDYVPHDLSRLARQPGEARAILSRHPRYRERLVGAEDPDGLIQQLIEELTRNRVVMESRFNDWNAIQDGIAVRHNAVEFRRAGAIQCQLFDLQLGQEKAVDVKLATDLIVLKDIYDAAIIFSGDQDYVPAIQVIKDYGKRVINVAFRNRAGRLLPGGARRLNQVTDRSFVVNYQDLNRFLHIDPPQT